VTAIDLQKAADIEPAFTNFSLEAGSGVIVGPNPFNADNREKIISLAASLQLPAIYPYRYFAENGGLVAPTKYEFVINLKAANALGLDLSPQLQQRADEVIE
jgi:putative tryptophan/tyrosine transport system substrate-binding protein